MTSSQATQLKIDCLFCGSRELKYKYQLQLFWELNKLRCHIPKYLVLTVPKNIDSSSHTQTSIESTVYTHNYIQKYIHSSPHSWLWYIYCLWPPEGQIIEQDYKFSPSSFFYYIFMTVGVVVTGPGLVYIHTYIIL